MAQETNMFCFVEDANDQASKELKVRFMSCVQLVAMSVEINIFFLS